MPEETPQALALKVLRAISKSTNSALQLDDVPEEFLVGETVDLQRWTLVMTDKNMKQLSEPPATYSFVDCAKPQVPEFFHDFFSKPPKSSSHGITSLNISGAKQVTELGLALFARKNTNLQYLNLSNCIEIGDAGMRDVGMNCPSLMSLNISGCHAITGQGLVSIAECCRFLTTLDVSKCKNLEKFGLTKLFFECKNLEKLNLSYLPQISDEEVRVLALNCPNIYHFDAKESCQISDQSILKLTQCCADLDYVDVSRSQMAFRISDVSLLALGERAKALLVLKCSGCEQLTDVGLSWLTAGCASLTELDLDGCKQVSDAGLRSLGASCRALTALNISNAKMVSDAGIANLTRGCPQLKSLNVHGLFYLSDSKAIKGATSFIGMHALSANSPHLTHLDCSGCFRLSKTFLRHFPHLTNLKVVNFSNCNQATPEGFAAFAKSTPLREEANLSDCGKAVDTLSVTAFAQSCPKLRVLVICRNIEGVLAGVMSAIAKNCDSLEKLDVSGCKGLADMMMLPITELDRVMKLQTLLMLNLPLITDTTLAWLASKTQDIRTLALRGTAVSAHAVQAVKDRFGKSDMVQNQNFVGFLPKFRIEDCELANRYYYAKQGWIKLQARQRAWLAKVRVKGITERRRRKKAVAVLQSMCRVFIAINRVFYKRRERDRLHRRVLLITSVFRIAKAKKIVLRRRMHLNATFRLNMCVKLQTRWRIYLAKCFRHRLWLEHQEWLRKRYYGAAKFQSIVRVRMAKRRVQIIKDLRRGRALVEERKATVIERSWRGSRGRLRAKERRRFLEWYTVRRDISCRKIQNKARIRFTNNIVKARQAKKRRRNGAAVKIQSVMRGALDRLHIAQTLAEESEVAYDAAALVIQRHWKVKQARILCRNLRRKKADLEAKRSVKAIMIQCSARQKIARGLLYHNRIEYLQSLRNRAQLEMWAICKIQAAYRGYRGRIYVLDQRRLRKGKWKELYDEEQQKRFFYNKITGEIRWRMPQDLLDLIPRPCCDNCSFYEGQVECFLCNEVFCTQCFEQVHYGGRRKDHEFRSLFDYYGKRIDYGDGVFPSKWPSEVIQDEIQGWMLRVAPIRDPVAVYDDWEEYNEIQPDGAPGRIFYFNRKTYEASYDLPPAVGSLQSESLRQQQLHDSIYNRSLPFDTMQRTHPPPAGPGGGQIDFGMRTEFLTRGTPGHQATASSRDLVAATPGPAKKSKKQRKREEEEQRRLMLTQSSKKPELKNRNNPFATTS